MSDILVTREAVPLDRIDRNPKQPRKVFHPDELEDLAASIRKRGLLQKPRLRRMPGDRFMIVFGERRVRACRLGHQRGWLPCSIDADIVDCDKRQMGIDAILENLQRSEISDIEEAEGYQEALDTGMTVAELADELGVMQRTIEEKLSLLTLEPQVMNLVAQGALSGLHGIALAKVEHADQTRIVQAINNGSMTSSYFNVAAAVRGVQEARTQVSIFETVPVPAAPSVDDRRALSSLERRVSQLTAMLGAGFRNGECVAAKRCDPDRLGTLADQLALIRRTCGTMERQLRDALAQKAIAV